MELLNLIVKYGLYPVAISFICFFVCGIVKTIFYKRFEIKFTDKLLRQKKIREMCQWIEIFLGAILLILAYCLIEKNYKFYLDLNFYLNFVAIPTISSMIYTIYQGKQDGKIPFSLKKFLHFCFNGFITISKKLFEKDKAKLNIVENIEKELNEKLTLLQRDKELMDNILKKYKQ